SQKPVVERGRLFFPKRCSRLPDGLVRRLHRGRSLATASATTAAPNTYRGVGRRAVASATIAPRPNPLPKGAREDEGRPRNSSVLHAGLSKVGLTSCGAWLGVRAAFVHVLLGPLTPAFSTLRVESPYLPRRGIGGIMET